MMEYNDPGYNPTVFSRYLVTIRISPVFETERVFLIKNKIRI
jgi:hypothetical protein